MNKLLLILTVFVITLTVSSEAQAQKNSEREFEINTTTPTFSVILELKDKDGNDLGMLDVQIVDRVNQLVNVKTKRLNDQLKGNDPIRPKLKLVAYPEIDGRTYRLAESIEELQAPVDNVKVLLVDYMVVLEAMRVKYF